jgi:hypothetical protein
VRSEPLSILLAILPCSMLTFIIAQ